MSNNYASDKPTIVILMSCWLFSLGFNQQLSFEVNLVCVVLKRKALYYYLVARPAYEVSLLIKMKECYTGTVNYHVLERRNLNMSVTDISAFIVHLDICKIPSFRHVTVSVWY